MNASSAKFSWDAVQLNTPEGLNAYQNVSSTPNSRKYHNTALGAFAALFGTGFAFGGAWPASLYLCVVCAIVATAVNVTAKTALSKVENIKFEGNDFVIKRLYNDRITRLSALGLQFNQNAYAHIIASSHNRSANVGHFLSEDERNDFLKILKEAKAFWHLTEDQKEEIFQTHPPKKPLPDCV